MLTRRLREGCIFFLLALGAIAHADPITARSNGKLDVATDANKSLTVDAKSTLGLTSLTAGATYNGNAGALDDWSLKVRRPPELKGTYIGKGYKDVNKFPSPVTRSANMTLTKGTAPDVTTSTAAASWTSNGDNDKTRGADLAVSASVVQATKDAPSNIVTAAVIDPWLIENPGLSPIDFHLVITLQDVELVATGDFNEFSLADLGASAAFGWGDIPGENILVESSPFFQAVRNGDSPFTLSSLTLVDTTQTLQPGVTYWLTAELDGAAATQSVPEPATFGLVAVGAAAILVMRAVKKDSVELLLASTTDVG
jgi:hypothetical protein